MEYTVIKSGRKTLALEVSKKGVIVRAPYAATDKQIKEFVSSHEDWITKHIARLEQHMQEIKDAPVLTPQEIKTLADRAVEYIPGRVQYFAGLLGVTYGRITIRNQKTKWGSCSGKGNLNFNCLLMLTPPKAIDSVVAHEVCHLKQMNHSKEFYALVRQIYPEYDVWDKWLKENAAGIVNSAQM